MFYFRVDIVRNKGSVDLKRCSLLLPVISPKFILNRDMGIFKDYRSRACHRVIFMVAY